VDLFEKRSDAELLAQARHKPGAFVAFYRRHERLVLRNLLWRCRDGELAADLAAETFAVIFEIAERFDPERAGGTSAVPWLLGIARYTWLASIRHGVVVEDARRRLGYEPLVLDDEDLARVDALASIDPSLDESLDALPHDLREAVVARFVDERDYGEIAAALGCSELVVRKRVSRGLSRLRAVLSPAQFDF
jgi:RNA polymerase sigma-70 factor (ECF subfamily)